MRRSIRGLAVLVTTTAALATAGQALAVEEAAPEPGSGIQVNEQLPFEATIENPCACETVEVTGTVHHVLKEHTTPSGNVHVVEHFNFQGVRGTTSDGTAYVMNGANSLVQNVGGDGTPVVSSFTASQKLNRVGPGGKKNDDLSTHVNSHLTINGNGKTTSDKFVVREGCR